MFFEILRFDLLMAIFRFFAIYPLLSSTESVERTKWYRDLKFGIYSLYMIIILALKYFFTIWSLWNRSCNYLWADPMSFYGIPFKSQKSSCLFVFRNFLEKIGSRDSLLSLSEWVFQTLRLWVLPYMCVYHKSEAETV